MIGYLKGTLIQKQPPILLLDVHGVGYELEAPMTTFYDLPEEGKEIALHTHLVVREDAQLLYAFSRLAERNLFRSLLKVSGVGPRVALAILSGLSAEDFHACISHNDSAMLTRVPGIGRKTAERLIVEMRDRLSDIEPSSDAVKPSAGSGEPSAAQDAVSALIALGYRAADASRVVRGLKAQDLDRESLIRQALQSLS